MNETETLTSTSCSTTDLSTLRVELKIRLAKAEDFYRLEDGKKRRYYGMIYYAEHCTIDGRKHFTTRRFSKHELSIKELAALLILDQAYVNEGIFIIEANDGII